MSEIQRVREIISKFGVSEPIYTTVFPSERKRCDSFYFSLKERYTPQHADEGDFVARCVNMCYKERWDSEAKKFKVDTHLDNVIDVMHNTVIQTVKSHHGLELKYRKFLRNFRCTNDEKYNIIIGLYTYIKKNIDTKTLQLEDEHKENLFAIIRFLKEKYEQ